MAFTLEQSERAKKMQAAAAHDASPQVRVIAGPGTGKSWTIEERVRWLLGNGVSPNSIYVVSFTRASARDLRRRIQESCRQDGDSRVDQIRVTTLHSLALITLRLANLLKAYPVEPTVLDDWELEDIFDDEFGDTYGIGKD